MIIIEKKVWTTYLEFFLPAENIAPVADPKIKMEELPSISKEQYSEVFEAIGGLYGWVSDFLYPENSEAALIADDCTNLFLVRKEGEVCGFSQTRTTATASEKELEVLFFGVFPNYARQGIGKILMNYIFTFASGNGYHRVWLHTCECDHPKAINFYKSCGFKVYDEGWSIERFPESFSPNTPMNSETALR